MLKSREIIKTEEIIARFDEENKSDVPWWKCWAKIRVGYIKVTSYLLNTLDEFILEMENYFQLSTGVRVAGNHPLDGDRYSADSIASRDALIDPGHNPMC